MHPSIGTVAEQFRITTNLFIKAMSGVDKNTALRRPGEWSNPLLWMAGHVIHFRTRLLSLVGVPRDFPWGSRFDTGSKVGSAESYPEPAELVAMWEELSELLVDRLGTLTEADLAAPPAARVPTPWRLVKIAPSDERLGRSRLTRATLKFVLAMRS